MNRNTSILDAYAFLFVYFAVIRNFTGNFKEFHLQD